MGKKKSSPSGPWGISIRTPSKVIMKVIPREYPNEPIADVLNRAKLYAKAIRNSYQHRSDMIVELVSRSVAFPKPSGVVVRRGDLWCPYCAKPRRFKKNQLIEIDGIEYISPDPRCIICTMSDSDFYVRTYNHTWPLNVSGSSPKKKKG